MPRLRIGFRRLFLSALAVVAASGGCDKHPATLGPERRENAVSEEGATDRASGDWYFIESPQHNVVYWELRRDGKLRVMVPGMWYVQYNTPKEFPRVKIPDEYWVEYWEPGSFQLLAYHSYLQSGTPLWTRGAQERIRRIRVDEWLLPGGESTVSPSRKERPPADSGGLIPGAARLPPRPSSASRIEGSSMFDVPNVWEFDSGERPGGFRETEFDGTVQIWSAYSGRDTPWERFEFRPDGSMARIAEGTWRREGTTFAIRLPNGMECELEPVADPPSLVERHSGVPFVRLSSPPPLDAWVPPVGKSHCGRPLSVDWRPLRAFGAWHEPQYNGDFGPGYHLGEDVPADAGTPVRTMAPGRIVYAEYWKTGGGYVVVVQHLIDGEPFSTVYYHMKPPATRVPLKVGDIVVRGAPIGRVSGEPKDHFNSLPHLHFGIRKGAYQEGNDPRTGHWYYAGYSTISPNRPGIDNPTHAQVLREWLKPSELFASRPR